MQKLCLRIGAALLSFCAAPAQTGARSYVAPELAQYLQLTASQAAAINQLAASWNSDLQDKARLAEQINGTIRTETAKGAPDPSVLGPLYVQLESVCRDAANGRSALLQKTRDVLDTSQRSRLQALDDAFALLPRVIEAQRAGVVADSIETSPVGFPAGQITVSLNLIASPPAVLPGCLPPAPVSQPGTIPVLRAR